MAMVPVGGPLDDVLPGEHEIAAYRGGELTLTNRRVVYRGRGLARHGSASLLLTDSTAVAISRRRFQPRLFLVPALAFLFGLLGSFTIQDEGPMIVGLFVAMFTLFLPWLPARLLIEIAVPGYTLAVPVARRNLAAARLFLQQLEQARFASLAQEHGAAVVMPSTSPFRGG